MRKKKYILVDESALKGGRRSELINRLIEQRRHYPQAKIMGKSEVNTSSNHQLIRVNPEMNRLRRELSDMP